jgi:hypothetical protein
MSMREEVNESESDWISDHVNDCDSKSECTGLTKHIEGEAKESRNEFP